MVMTLADARLKATVLTTRPADPNALTAAEANAGEDVQCRVLKSDFRLSPTASDTVPDTVLCSEGNAVVFGASNYEGSVTPIRELTAAGLADALNDIAWDTFKEKGTRLWIVLREGPRHEVDYLEDDEYDLFEVITDNPQAPSDRGGYIKRVVPLGVQNAWLNRKIVAAAG